MLLYLLSKKIFQKIRPSPADGKADGGTWFGNFYLTDILWGEHTQLTFIRRMLSDAALGMQDIDSLQQVAYETGITPCLRVTLLIGLRQRLSGPDWHRYPSHQSSCRRCPLAGICTSSDD